MTSLPQPSGPPKKPTQQPGKNVDKLTISVSSAPKKTTEEIKQTAALELEQLESEVEAKRDVLVKIKYSEWCDLKKKNKAISEMRKYLPGSAGLETLIKGMNAKEGSEQHTEAYECLNRIVERLNKRSQYIEGAAEKQESIKEDMALNSIGGVLNSITTNFKRGSGLEKVASLAALGIGIYFLNKFWKDTKSGKWILGIGLGGLAANILIKLGTGKSLLDHLGIWQAKDTLAHEIKLLAEKAKIADDPKKLKAMATLGGNKIKDCYSAYIRGGAGGTIDPTELGVYDGSLDSRETFDIINTLVLKAGGGNLIKGRKVFEEKYMKPSPNGRPWTLFEVAMELFGKEGSEMIVDIEKEKWKEELGQIFRGHNYGVSPENWPDNITVFGCPMQKVERNEYKENPTYVFYVDENASIRIPLKQSQTEREKSMELLANAVKAKAKNLLPNDPKLKNAKMEAKNGKLYLIGIDVDGEKVDPEIAFHKAKSGKYTLQLKNEKGQVVKEFATPDETLTKEDLEKAQYALKISACVPAFRGLDVRVHYTNKYPDNDPKGIGWKYIKGEVEGIPFKAGFNEKENRVHFYNADEVLKSGEFISAKCKHAKEKLRPAIANLENIIHEVSERHIRLTVFYKGISGSIRENLWVASAKAKEEELVKIYENKLKEAKDLDEAHRIWNDTIGKYQTELENLHDNNLFDAIKKDKKFSDKDFKTALNELDKIGYKSPGLQGTMQNIRDKMLSSFNYDGLDQSDLWDCADKVYGEARKAVNHFTLGFATQDSLTPNQKAYMKYLEGGIVDQLTKVKIKSEGLAWTGFKKSVNRENLPSNYTGWGIKEYAEWAAINPDAGVQEKEKTGLKVPKILAEVQNKMIDFYEEARKDAKTKGKSNKEINEVQDMLRGKKEEGYPIYQAKSKEIAAIADPKMRLEALEKYHDEVRKVFGLPPKIKEPPAKEKEKEKEAPETLEEIKEKMKILIAEAEKEAKAQGASKEEIDKAMEEIHKRFDEFAQYTFNEKHHIIRSSKLKEYKKMVLRIMLGQQ